MAEAAYNGVDNLDCMAELAPKYNKFLAKLVETHLRGEKKVLDFGAGTGTFAEMLRQKGIEVVCVEPDVHLQEQLRAKQLETHASIMSLPQSSQPAIYTFNVLEHIEDDLEAMRQIFSRLKPGGRLLVYVPAFEILFSSMDKKVGHFRRYTRADLSSRLVQAGFDIERAFYADSLGFAASLFYKYFGNERGDLNPKALRSYDRWAFPVSRTLDVFMKQFAGKNVVVVARRPEDEKE